MPGPGDVFAHYRVGEKLGEGAFGSVYRAEDIRLHRNVALKILHAQIAEDAEAWGRLLSEARAASALNHPNICALYDIGEEDGLGYIAMEYIGGRSLGEMLRAGPLPAATAIAYAAQMASALAHAHGRGIIHRDLKSSNVIVTPEGQAKLLDFGLARRLESQEIDTVSQSRRSLADLGGLAGTLCYMAPELLRGKPADVRSDLWSLGALLYETLAGALPFRGETPFELSLAIMVQETPSLPARIPAALRATIVKCLEKDPARRYGTSEEVSAALERARAALSGPRWKSRVRPRSAWIAGLACVLLIGAGLVWRHRRLASAAAAASAVHSSSAPPAPEAAKHPPQQAPAIKPLKSAPHAAMPTHAKLNGNPNTEVWVNAKTRIYHCPGTRWYRRTAHGELLTQREAQRDGYEPASGETCP